MSPDPAMARRSRGLIRYAVSDLSRFGKITSVLVRHGFGPLVERLGLSTAPQVDGMSTEELAADPAGTAKRFRAVLEELGPTFVKLGQILSTRPDLLPPVYIVELAKLQDQSPPMSYETVREQLEAAFGRSPDTVFKRFERVELATGSIAQTHMAELPGGREVVVKVQRPGLDDIIRSDLDLLRLLARLLESTIEEMGLYSPTSIVDEFDRALRNELDFRVEASHIAIFRELTKDDPTIWIPDVFGELSSRTVLVMERIPGVKITDLEPDTPRAKKLALKTLDLAYRMLFEFGTFHGDPHPGNILVTDDDRVGLIDFGLIGQISQLQQDVLVSLIIAIVSGDVDGIARAVMQLGRPLGRVPLREMREDIVSIRSRYLKNSLGDVNVSQFILELLEAGQRYRISVPAEYAILTKASVSMEGIIRHLYPSIDIPSALAPYSRKMLLTRYGPQRLSQTLLTGALSAGGLMREIPMQISQLLLDLEYEGLRVQVENPGLTELRRSLTTLGSKVAYALITAAVILGFFVLVVGNAGTAITVTIGLIAALMCLQLWLWHLVDARARKLRVTPLLRLLQRARGD